MSAARFPISALPSLSSPPPPMHLPRPSGEQGTLATRYEALSRLSHSLVCQKPEELPHRLNYFLGPLLDFEFVDLVVFKEGSSEVFLHSIGEGRIPVPDVPMEETTYWWVYQQKQPLVISDWRRDDRFARRREALKRQGLEFRSLCRLPLRTPDGPIGVLSFVSFRPHDHSEDEMRFLSLTADLVSMAVANLLYRERAQNSHAELLAKRDRLKFLQEVTGSLAANPDLDDLLAGFPARARHVLRSDFAILSLLDPESGRLSRVSFDACNETKLDITAVNSLGETLAARVRSMSEPLAGHCEDLVPKGALEEGHWVTGAFKQSCVMPLLSRDQTLGVLAMSRRDSHAYTQDELEFLSLLSGQVALAVDNAAVCGELRQIKEGSRDATVVLEKRVRSGARFEEIVGRSSALQRVLREVEIVAPTDSSVLINGETGTGKELIASAIHRLSPRCGRPFVKVNCAAIPSGLLESELFGHEKGAFTGAIMRKAGRFELADKGTIFLDEVGDIPLELQPKLLRVLQEHEFERLGATRTQAVDVRVIAATHRDLKKMVEDGEFRSDLYYRLHVFPLSVPPLRERREDIPLLVHHYVQRYARQMNRRIDTIPSPTMETIAGYPWPGNVRELQNFIERAVILSPGGVLRAPLADLKEAPLQAQDSKLSTLEEAEREHVMRALRESNWIVGGSGGAAARLGMKRTTLAYRIRKLGIPCRPH